MRMNVIFFPALISRCFSVSILAQLPLRRRAVGWHRRKMNVSIHERDPRRWTCQFFDNDVIKFTRSQQSIGTPWPMAWRRSCSNCSKLQSLWERRPHGPKDFCLSRSSPHNVIKIKNQGIILCDPLIYISLLWSLDFDFYYVLITLCDPLIYISLLWSLDFYFYHVFIMLWWSLDFYFVYKSYSWSLDFYFFLHCNVLANLYEKLLKLGFTDPLIFFCQL